MCQEPSRKVCLFGNIGTYCYPFCAGSAGLKPERDQEGVLRAEDAVAVSDRQVFGAHKAEKLLYFTARSLALAKWADLEALIEFYEGLLEVFWTSPPDGPPA